MGTNEADSSGDVAKERQPAPPQLFARGRFNLLVNRRDQGWAPADPASAARDGRCPHARRINRRGDGWEGRGTETKRIHFHGGRNPCHGVSSMLWGRMTL